MSSLPESESEAESAVLLRLLTAAQPVPRGEAPSGVRLERLPHVDELLVADRDFLPGQPVLRERFLLLGPSELPPLHMFRPVPQDVGTVEIVGAEVGFPGAVVFDNEHLKLLLEFLNSEEAVQADVLRMQDGMEPGSETFESTRRVAQWLIDQQLPWLEGPTQELEVLARLLRLFCVNSHPCKVAGNTSGLLKWGTMINHSSVPNVVYSSAKVIFMMAVTSALPSLTLQCGQDRWYSRRLQLLASPLASPSPLASQGGVEEAGHHAAALKVALVFVMVVALAGPISNVASSFLVRLLLVACWLFGAGAFLPISAGLLMTSMPSSFSSASALLAFHVMSFAVVPSIVAALMGCFSGSEEGLSFGIALLFWATAPAALLLLLAYAREKKGSVPIGCLSGVDDLTFSEINYELARRRMTTAPL
ncbi:unnamed protein product [Polarella glacialis]|uniref:Uncharacterized protein n=1 Tax=Polarella glacialis TaxID=89957 RepID=A0A813JET7_POLGL|nr:unnamed protein product [Polarella glacialis]